jgi:hypothetical protein
MNFGEAVANVAKKLGNRVDLDDSIEDEMKLAQAELEAARSLPWFLLSEELYTTLAAGATSGTVPSDFLREHEDGALWLEDTTATPSTYTKLVKVSLDDLRTVEATGDSDESPAYYSLVGGNFYVAPPAATDKRLRILCYRRADTLTVDADTNVWLDNTPEVLISKTGMRMAQYLRSTELYAMFQSQYMEAMQAMEHSTVARGMENFEASMGGG